MKRAVPIVVLPSASAASIPNGTPEPRFFTITSRSDATRTGAARDPGGKPCRPETASAIFTALAASTGVEGFPRLSGPDGRDRRLHVMPTNMCHRAAYGG